MEMDQASLKEMGVKKVGDRVRISAQIKSFRTKEYKRPSQRNSNRVSIDAGVEHHHYGSC